MFFPSVRLVLPRPVESMVIRDRLTTPDNWELVRVQVCPTRWHCEEGHHAELLRVIKIARRSGFLPEPLFEIFKMLMREETWHVVFFTDWMAWQQTARGYGARWLRAAIAAWYYSRAIGRLLGTLWCMRDANDRKDFSATQASVLLNGSHFRGFAQQCCAEHARRMAGFDYDLLLPRLLSTVAGVVLAGRRLPPSVA
jgi:hypothetical protein